MYTRHTLCYIPNEALWCDEIGIRACGINENARAHSKICSKPLRMIVTSSTHFYTSNRLFGECAHCQKLKRNGFDVKRLRKRRKSTTKEWVTVCSWVWVTARGEKKRKSGTNLWELRFIGKSQQHFGLPFPCESNGWPNSAKQTVEQSNGSWESARVCVCVRARANAAMHPSFQLSKYYIQKKQIFTNEYRRLRLNQIRIQIKRTTKYEMCLKNTFAEWMKWASSASASSRTCDSTF